MAPSAVSQIETGKRSPNSQSVMKLAEALGVEVAELYPKAPQAPLPLEEERLIDRPEVQEWLRGEGHMTDEEFLSWAEELYLDIIDADGFPQGIETAIQELRQARDGLLDALKTSRVRNVLFPRQPGSSKEEAVKAVHRQARSAWKLGWEIRHEYLAREVALVNYSRQLFAEGETADYLVYGTIGEHDSRRHQMLEEKRRRVLEESYAKAIAV
jgi:transcriptional regulator with XRE-family HTH domain